MSGSAVQAAEWDARYREREGARWSGRPNGRLIAEVAGLEGERLAVDRTRLGKSRPFAARYGDDLVP